MSKTLLWPAWPLPKTIPSDEVHLWAWSFPTPDQQLEPHPADLKILDPAERNQTSRYHFGKDRLRYAISHANLRRILAGYLQRAPESLQFHAGTHGKPELAPETNSQDLRFNLSHSKSIGVLAVAQNLDLGVDVEDIRAIEPAVAERFFSTAEQASLSTLKDAEWLQGFYNCWTRKEAILKAEGLGLQVPLDSFDVSLVPGEPARLLAARPESRFTAKWTLYHFSPASGVIGALATSASKMRIEKNAFVSTVGIPD